MALRFKYDMKRINILSGTRDIGFHRDVDTISALLECYADPNNNSYRSFGTTFGLSRNVIKKAGSLILNLTIYILIFKLYRINVGCVWPVRFSLYTSAEKMNKVHLRQLI